MAHNSDYSGPAEKKKKRKPLFPTGLAAKLKNKTGDALQQMENEERGLRKAKLKPGKTKKPVYTK